MLEDAPITGMYSCQIYMLQILLTKMHTAAIAKTSVIDGTCAEAAPIMVEHEPVIPEETSAAWVAFTAASMSVGVLHCCPYWTIETPAELSVHL